MIPCDMEGGRRGGKAEWVGGREGGGRMQIAGAKDGRKDGEEKKEVRKGVGERRNGEKGRDNKTDRRE